MNKIKDLISYIEDNFIGSTPKEENEVDFICHVFDKLTIQDAKDIILAFYCCDKKLSSSQKLKILLQAPTLIGELRYETGK